MKCWKWSGSRTSLAKPLCEHCVHFTARKQEQEQLQGRTGRCLSLEYFMSFLLVSEMKEKSKCFLFQFPFLASLLSFKDLSCPKVLPLSPACSEPQNRHLT